jgi:hypothetical protein
MLFKHHQPKRVLLIFFVISLTITVLSGCGLREIREDTQTASTVVRIEGRVENNDIGTVRVLLTESRSSGDVLINLAELSGDGEFAFDTTPGTYLVSAYVDINGDGAYQPDEPAAVNGNDQGLPNPVVLGTGV